MAENEAKEIYTREQVDGIMNDFKTNVLPQIKTAIEARQKKSTGVTLVTLNSAPTASTLQYTIGEGQDAKTYDFKIGDEVRVADSENASDGANGYVFYKLHDITGSGNNKTAYWDLGASGGGGGGALGKVKVYLKDIINDVENLSPTFAGVVVTLTNTSDAGSTPVTKTLAAGEKSVIFTKVTPLKNYSVSVAQLDAQHTTPAAQTITNLAIGEEKELTFNYEADEYTVNIASNQGTDSAISGAKVTYNNQQYGNGDTFKVAKGTTVSLTTSAMSDVTDYAKSISQSGKSINALYSTTLVAISVVSNQSDFTERKQYTINGTAKFVTATGTTPALTGTVKVATGTALNITAPDIEHYAKNVASYGNATGTSQTIEVTYSATKVNLNMVGVVNGVEGNFPTGAQGTVKHTSGADQTLTDNTTTALVPTGSAFTIEYAGVSGYGTPANYSSTAAGTAMTADKASYVYGVLVVELTMNDADDTALASAKAYITVGSGSEQEMSGSIASHVKTFSMAIVPGTTYSLRFGDVTGYATPAAVTNQTKASGLETVQKQYATTILTVTLASDTGEADLSGVTKTVTDTTASAVVAAQQDGTYKIPTGHGYSVSVSDDVEGYKAPATATGTASGASASVTMTYEEQAGFVDLGLPSGLKWAQANIVKDAQGNYAIGENPEDYGCYFSWGNIVGHNNGEGYDFGTSNSGPYASTPGKQVTANIASNDAQHDAALALLGSPWRLPTKEEFQELYDNTDREWTTINGINGWKFMKKSDHSLFVFFPAAGYGLGSSIFNVGSRGYYWSSSWYSADYAYYMYFYSSSVYPQSNYYRYDGFSVRAVQ